MTRRARSQSARLADCRGAGSSMATGMIAPAAVAPARGGGLGLEAERAHGRLVGPTGDRQPLAPLEGPQGLGGVRAHDGSGRPRVEAALSERDPDRPQALLVP